MWWLRKRDRTSRVISNNNRLLICARWSVGSGNSLNSIPPCSLRRRIFWGWRVKYALEPHSPIYPLPIREAEKDRLKDLGKKITSPQTSANARRFCKLTRSAVRLRNYKFQGNSSQVLLLPCCAMELSDLSSYGSLLRSVVTLSLPLRWRKWSLLWGLLEAAFMAWLVGCGCLVDGLT